MYKILNDNLTSPMSCPGGPPPQMGRAVGHLEDTLHELLKEAVAVEIPETPNYAMPAAASQVSHMPELAKFLASSTEREWRYDAGNKARMREDSVDAATSEDRVTGTEAPHLVGNPHGTAAGDGETVPPVEDERSTFPSRMLAVVK